MKQNEQKMCTNCTIVLLSKRWLFILYIQQPYYSYSRNYWKCVFFNQPSLQFIGAADAFETNGTLYFRNPCTRLILRKPNIKKAHVWNIPIFSLYMLVALWIDVLDFRDNINHCVVKWKTFSERNANTFMRWKVQNGERNLTNFLICKNYCQNELYATQERRA